MKRSSNIFGIKVASMILTIPNINQYINMCCVKSESAFNDVKLWYVMIMAGMTPMNVDVNGARAFVNREMASMLWRERARYI